MKNTKILDQNWRDVEIVALDIETSGQYPIVDDICELAAVKTKNGEIIETFQTLVKPRQSMTDFVIGIHGISNDMVAEAPKIEDVIASFSKFVGEGVAVGHHSPFDIGFLVVDYEKNGLPLTSSPFLCSSLLARNTITGVANHRLQTLVKHLNIDGGQAHRALDDAKACWEVMLHCFEKNNATLISDIVKRQGHELWWSDYSYNQLRHGSNAWANLMTCLENKKTADIVYMGGSRKGEKRQVQPLGLVINPQGNYLVADDGGEKPKRYYFNKIREAEVIYS